MQTWTEIQALKEILLKGLRLLSTIALRMSAAAAATTTHLRLARYSRTTQTHTPQNPSNPMEIFIHRVGPQ